MTFEFFCDELPFFDGWALRDLIGFRKRSRDNLSRASSRSTTSPSPRSIFGCLVHLRTQVTMGITRLDTRHLG